MKSKTPILAGLLCAGALGGCVIVDADVRDSWDDDDHFVRVMGAEITRAGPEPAIQIIASSNGCTDETQFDPVVRHRGGADYRVGFRRIEEDRCKAFVPEGKRLTWTYRQLGLPETAQVRILNQIGR
ncbi:MAG: hypothetical protein R3C52_00545 [Hyphomonadaceae bacterium]